jgi:hypothetical protein
VKRQASKQKPPSGHKRLDEIYRGSSFKVLMQRYNSAPKPARFCSDTTIHKLSDPVRGRYRGVELAAEGYIVSPLKESPRKVNTKKNAPSFFLTGEDDDNDLEPEDADADQGEYVEPRRLNVSRHTNVHVKDVSKNRLSESVLKNKKKKENVKPRNNMFEENERNRLLQGVRNSKTNRSLFKDKYLSTRTQNNHGASSGYGQPHVFKAPNKWIPGKHLKKPKLEARPEWTLRPPQPKASTSAKLLKPVLPQVARKVPAKAVKAQAASTSKAPLRSKSSADVRPGPASTIGSSGGEDSSLLSRKPSSTSNLDGTGKRRSSIFSKSATVLSPIKPIPPKVPDITDKIEARYQKLKKTVGLVTSDKSKKGTAGNSPETDPRMSRVDADANVRAALSRAMASTLDRASVQENSAALMLGTHAKKISNQFSQIDDWKEKYRTLAEEVE